MIDLSTPEKIFLSVICIGTFVDGAVIRSVCVCVRVFMKKKDGYKRSTGEKDSLSLPYAQV
jgi:hypothetical protein